MNERDDRSRKISQSILDRWPTADLFYEERDNRTLLATAQDSAYADREIHIFIDPEEASDYRIQMIALMACNLTARWARTIMVCVPDRVPLCEPAIRDNCQFLDQRLLREMFYADPFGTFACLSSPDSLTRTNPTTKPIRLFIGKWNRPSQGRMYRPEDFVVSCAGWSIATKRGKGLKTSQGETTGIAPVAGLVGSLAAADLFKRAIGHPSKDWIPSFVWDLRSHKLSKQLNSGCAEDFNYLDIGNLLLAGAGAVGSAVVYMMDLMDLKGRLTVLDRDRVETSNLNRSPVFNVYHAAAQSRKTDIVEAYLARHSSLTITKVDGTWHEHGLRLSREKYDAWLSSTNEDGAWAEIPFQLPPVLFQATTTSGWGFGAGRHIPRIEDCTLCRLPRPEAKFRGPCAEGDIGNVHSSEPIRAALPFLSAAAASLMLAELIKFSVSPSSQSPNEISTDLRLGLPAISTLTRLVETKCRGCQTMLSPIWLERGGRSRFGQLST